MNLDMPKENEKSQTSSAKPNPWEEKFDPQGALKFHPGFIEKYLTNGPGLEAVEAWLGISLAELKEQD